MIRDIVGGLWITVATSTMSVQTLDVRIPNGTPVRIRLLQFVSSETSQRGDPVRFEVAADIRRDGDVVIRRGTAVAGVVVDARPFQIGGFPWFWWGRAKPGRLVLSATQTGAVDGQVIRLRALEDENRRMGQKPTPLLLWSHEGEYFGVVVDGNYVIHN